MGKFRSQLIAVAFAALCSKCTCRLPDVPYLGDNLGKLEMAIWGGILYCFLILWYLSWKYIFPLIEELRLLIRDKKLSQQSIEGTEPELRVPELKESLWGGLVQALFSLFHLAITVVANTYQESQLGVTTLIGSAIIENMVILGLFLIVGKQAILLNSWTTSRDALIVAISSIIFLAFVFSEGSVFFVVIFPLVLLIYWVLEVLSKPISIRLNKFLAQNKEGDFESVQELEKRRRLRLNLKMLAKFVPHEQKTDEIDDMSLPKISRNQVSSREFEELEKNKKRDKLELMKKGALFNALYMDDRSTAKKQRIPIRKRLFMCFAITSIGIKRFKKDYLNKLKEERLQVYNTDTLMRRDEGKTAVESIFRKPDDREDSMAEEEEARELEMKSSDAKSLIGAIFSNSGLGKTIGTTEVNKHKTSFTQATSKTLQVPYESDEPVEEQVELYKGTYYKVIQVILKILMVLLFPFSLIFKLTLPTQVEAKKRRGRKHLIWGLIVGPLWFLLFSGGIIWLEDTLFLKKGYDTSLLGFAINAPLISLPAVLNFLSILDPKLP